MTVRTLLFIEFQVLIVVCIIGLFVWRYWYQPRQYQQQQAQRIAATPVAVSPPAGERAGTPPQMQSTPQMPSRPTSPATGGAPTPAHVPAEVPRAASLVKNGDFSKGLAYWSFWREAKTHPELVQVAKLVTPGGVRSVLRIENPYRIAVGVQQPVRVVSGSVYRLSARVRSVAGHSTNVIFGGRVAFYLPPQQEQEIVWVTECNQWWRRELVFTNMVDGVATVYAHLGYGNAATTGEFTDIALEKL